MCATLLFHLDASRPSLQHVWGLRQMRESKSLCTRAYSKQHLVVPTSHELMPASWIALQRFTVAELWLPRHMQQTFKVDVQLPRMVRQSSTYTASTRSRFVHYPSNQPTLKYWLAHCQARL